MHRNRNPCNSFLMVKMASGMDHLFIAAMINHTSSYHSPLNLRHFKLRLVGMLLGTINLLPRIRYRLLIGLWPGQILLPSNRMSPFQIYILAFST